MSYQLEIPNTKIHLVKYQSQYQYFINRLQNIRPQYPDYKNPTLTHYIINLSK